MSSQIKCYVINLDRSSSRLDHMNQVFSEQNLAFERVTAIDGALLSDEEFNHLTSNQNWLYKLSPNEVGCFLSHRECLRQVAENSESYAAIFEDDILLSSNIHFFLQNSDWIPEETDIVKLDTGKINCAVRNPISIKIKEISISYKLAKIVSKHYCAGGYIISRKCANKLYKLTEYATAPIDEIYFNPDYGFLRSLNVQQMMPALVVQQTEIESTIETQRKIGKRKNSPLRTRIRREIQRTYRKRILLPWLAMTGHQVGKIPFE